MRCSETVVASILQWTSLRGEWRGGSGEGGGDAGGGALNALLSGDSSVLYRYTAVDFFVGGQAGECCRLPLTGCAPTKRPPLWGGSFIEFRAIIRTDGTGSLL